MNFLALIGIAESVQMPEANKSYAILSLNVGKTFADNVNDDVFEIIHIQIDSQQFKSELKQINKNDIVGIKGHLASQDGHQISICERLQVF
ncbi:MAG: hypothetical protein LBV37_01730 [Mycoplasmataceae bacterium]|jgi:hypothetical protein|nr:hypothetical protein [Mycoplasmataceae bacterium]